ncbi:ABC transporter permease [Azospirillum endophyticum]
MTFDLALAWNSLPALLNGAWMTILITASVMAVGAVLGFGMCLVRMSRSRALAAIGAAYVAVFRGAPSIVLLYLVYAGLPQLSIVRDTPLWILFASPLFCAILGLGLNHSAYVVEILRGGLSAVPAGPVEAALALGLPPRIVFIKVRLPIAVRYGLKAYQNEVLIFLKSTVAVGAVTIADLTGAANEIFSMTYDPFTPLVTAGAMYWLLTNGLRLGFEAVDRRLNRHLAADLPDRRPATVRRPRPGLLPITQPLLRRLRRPPAKPAARETH